MIIPINDYVHIKPIQRDSPVASLQSDYDEKGIVQQDARSYTKYGIAMELKIGQTVYFDSWMASKYNAGSQAEFWLVPFEAIRAYESLAE